MAVPATGELNMLGLAKEKKYDDYNSASAITGPITLYDLFIGGNTKGSGESYDTTNTLSTSYPKPVTESEFIAGTDMPMDFNEWHDYDHDIGATCASYTSISLYPQISLNCDTSKPAVTRYINNSVWASATLLLVENAGNCILASAGYYYCGSCPQNGTEVRYWDGNSFTSSSGCP